MPLVTGCLHHEKKIIHILNLHQQQMNMTVSAIQHMVVLQEAGSELRGYY